MRVNKPTSYRPFCVLYHRYKLVEYRFDCLDEPDRVLTEIKNHYQVVEYVGEGVGRWR